MIMYKPETYASRNVALCTKDCLCLYVCPTGATDTENGQVDRERCISNCRLCVDSCPSHALSLMYTSYPPQQSKTDEVIQALLAIAKNKTEQEIIARTIAETSESPSAKTLAKAIEMSSRICAEEVYRESGYMIPQDEKTRELLRFLMDTIKDEEFPKEKVQLLIDSFTED